MNLTKTKNKFVSTSGIPYTAPLLFVCTANLARSPFAQAWARQHGLEAGSAGILAANGLAVPPPFVAVAHSFGLDLSRHRSQVLSARLVQEAGTIIPMTQIHASQIGALFPDVTDKISMLQHDGKPIEAIPDPASARPRDFDMIYRFLLACLEESLA